MVALPFTRKNNSCPFLYPKDKPTETAGWGRLSDTLQAEVSWSPYVPAGNQRSPEFFRGLSVAGILSFFELLIISMGKKIAIFFVLVCTGT